MMTPRFYIFGTPEGFDMLNGTLQDVSYFQRYYDGSKENTKFSIHRTAQGSVSYVFLKYSFSDCNSRTGAFFGMALVFDNEFCAAPLQLYKLFDYVYQKHVLYHDDSNKGFLKAINGSEVKAQFLISRFEEQQGHIEYIEKVLLVNLKKDDILSNAFYPLGPGFKNENPNLLVKMAMDGASDEKIVNNCRNYNYVTISPEWKGGGEDDPEVAPQVVLRWKDRIPEYQRFIIQCLGDLKSVDKNEVKKYQNQTVGILSQLSNNKYNKNISPNIESDYKVLCEQLADLYHKVETPPLPPLPPEPIPPIPPSSPTSSFWKNVNEWVVENKSKVAVMTGTVAAIVVILLLIRPKKGNKTEQYCCVKDVTVAFNEQLKNEDFANIDLDTISLTKAGRKLKESLQQRLDSAILCQTNKIDSLVEDAIKNKNWELAFQHCDLYYDTETKNEQKKNVETACIGYLEIEIEKLDNNNYDRKAGSIKGNLNKIKNQLDESEYDSLIGIVESKKPKDQYTLPQTDTYIVEVYNADNSFTPTKLYQSVTLTQNNYIRIDKSKNYWVKIKKNGNYIENKDLKSAVKTSDDKTFWIKEKGIGLFWKSSNPSETISIGDIVITITKE